MRRTSLTCLLLPALLLVPGCGGGGGGEKSNAFSVKGTEYAFLAPDRVKGGVLTMRVSNVGKEFHQYALGRLKPGKTFNDLKKELDSGNEPQSTDDVAGVPLLSPGKEISITRRLPAGRYVFICFFPSPKGVPHYKLGMIKPFEIAGTSDAKLPKPAATVTAGEKAMEVPPLKAGQQTLELKNAASKPREFTLVSVKPGKTVKDVEAMFAGEPPTPSKAPATFLGAMQSIPAGSSVFLDVKLEAGRKYVFVDAENNLMKEFSVG
jgi:hypothetical protein